MSSEKYPGHKELTSYLSQYENKSFWGFLLCCRDTIVTTASTTSRRQDLDTSWCNHFLAEAKERTTGYDCLVSTPSSLFRRPNFVVGKGLRIPEEESVMCLPFGACRLSSDFSIL
ncbi:24922_t:CDS:2 [Dentiscutata erythropus]|uniref:24922_t:CDS:1 n=1 Tax=Dentiscutata erythropus TaxID=1348616 RepID=A0A9N9HMW8_9GLOM|nr:24922_t:CDS:2 [Dentiscutata erythropus]